MKLMRRVWRYNNIAN